MDDQKINIPILLYHAIDPGRKRWERYAVAREEFEEQLKFLCKNNFATYTLEIFFKDGRRNREDQEGKKGIVLTFDDGYLSDYTFCVPILLRFGFKAVFFVTTGRIGTPGYLNWEQLKEMTGKGMSVQSHGVSHSFLSEMKNQEVIQELLESKNLIEKKFAQTS